MKRAVIGSRDASPECAGRDEVSSCFKKSTSFGNGYIFASRTSIATIYREALKIAHPYHVELVAHFMVFFSTIIVLVAMLFISQGAISICEGLLKIEPLFIKIVIYASDIFISAHFIKYLLQTWTH